MFSCVWLHFKKCFGKYFLMFGCVLENTIDNTFSTCCSHFLLVAHIFSVTKRIYNIIHSSKHKQNPKKIIKSEQTKARLRTTRSRSARSKLRAIAIDSFARCADRDQRIRGAGDVGTAPSTMPMMSTDGAVPVMSRSLLSFSLSLSLLFSKAGSHLK